MCTVIGGRGSHGVCSRRSAQDGSVWCILWKAFTLDACRKSKKRESKGLERTPCFIAVWIFFYTFLFFFLKGWIRLTLQSITSVTNHRHLDLKDTRFRFVGSSTCLTEDKNNRVSEGGRSAVVVATFFISVASKRSGKMDFLHGEFPDRPETRHSYKTWVLQTLHILEPFNLHPHY